MSLATIWEMGGATGSLAQLALATYLLSAMITAVLLYTTDVVLGTEPRTLVFARKALYQVVISPALIWHLCGCVCPKEDNLRYLSSSSTLF